MTFPPKYKRQVLILPLMEFDTKVSRQLVATSNVAVGSSGSRPDWPFSQRDGTTNKSLK